MPPRKVKLDPPPNESVTQEAGLDPTADLQQAPDIEDGELPPSLPVQWVTLHSSTEINYGVVKKTFGKTISVGVASLHDQQREYDKLDRQIEYHHQQWLANIPAWLRRMIDEFRARK